MRTHTLAAPRAMSDPSAPTGIVQVLGITCTTPDCGYHESLHTADPVEAVRTAASSAGV